MKKKFRRDLFYYLLLVMKALLYYVPYRWGFYFSAWLGKWTFQLLPKEKEKTLMHLRAAYSAEKTRAELEQAGRDVFQHYGKMVFELAMIDRWLPKVDTMVTTENFHYLDDALKAGKGLIVIVAHFGNWELMGGYAAYKGYPVTVIVRKIYFEKYDELIMKVRAKFRIKTIYRDGSVRQMLKVLNKNEILGFVVDQDVDTVEGTFINFFNKPAHTPVAPVRFAMKTGAPVIPAFIIRKGMKHHIIVEPPIELTQTGNEEEDVRINTQKWAAVQEKYIRKYPDHWVWNHARWKTRPVVSLLSD